MLPGIPASLTSLECYNNQLTQLPALPIGLGRLRCNNNQISCLPILPNTLVQEILFDITNNPITCLPNYVPAMDSAALAIPLCVAGDLVHNPLNCLSTTNIDQLNNRESVFNIFPNTVTGDFQIEFVSDISGSKKIEIVNSEGKIIYSISSGNKSLSLKSGSWSKGIYLICVSDGTNRQTKKIIKE